MTTMDTADRAERVQLAAEVYIYGYPLVYNLHEIDGFATTSASSRSALPITVSAMRARCPGLRPTADGDPLIDRRPGCRLATDDDGSVTIYIQRDPPGDGRQSNWLPTPDGRFRPLMRMYQPRAGILNGEYVLPAITKVR